MDKLDILASRIIAYNVSFTKITKSVTAGLLLSQLVYWAKVSGWGEFFKIDSEILEETGLTQEELRTAKKKIQHLVEIKRKGIPAKTHYFVKKKELLDALNNLETGTNSVLGNPHNLIREIPRTGCGDSPELVAGIPQNYNNETEITSEITSETPPTPSRRGGVRNEEAEEKFNIFWGLYPRKVDKKKAKEEYIKLVKHHREIIEGLERQAKHFKKMEPRFIPHPTTWLAGERWRDDLSLRKKNFERESHDEYADFLI